MRLCSAFVDNLTLILRTAFVVGALFLVQDLDKLFEKLNTPEVDNRTAPTTVEVEIAPNDATDVEAPILTEGVKRAFNCTYTAYRNAHYDECVKEPSGIYLKPHAGPDDASHVMDEEHAMYARL